MSSPQSVEELLPKAEEHLDLGEYQEAEELFGAVLELEPEHTTAINKLGVCRARQDDLAAAEAHFQRVLELDARHVGAISNLGNISYGRGNYDRAIELYEQAISLDPEYAVAHNNLAAAYKKKGKYEKFVHHIKRSQKLAMSAPPPRAGPGRRAGCLPRGALLASLALLLLYLL